MHLFDFFDSVYPLKDGSRKVLESLITEKKHKPLEIIQEMESPCKTLYFVKTGCARIYYFKDGSDITEHFAFENDLIVRAESLFNGKPTAKGIQAITGTEMIGINANKLFQLYDEHRDIERLFRLIFEKEYVNTVKRVESLQFQSATARYLELLKNTNYIQKIPLKYIASYLGITAVALSRLSSK
jgi:CRP-like cAMP-binding protein